MGRLLRLRQEGHTAAGISDKLNEEGFTPPKRCGPFSKELVRQLLSRRGLANEKTVADPLQTHEWWPGDPARELGVPATKLPDWMVRGWLHCRQTPAQGLWIAWTDRDELKRLRKLKARSKRGMSGYPAELTAPKKRPAK